MQTIGNGVVQYRSKAIDLATAQSFARCISGNSRFAGVEICRSNRSKAEKWFVAYQPANPERQDALVAAQVAAREKRAEEQEFMFWLDQGVWNCFSVSSGEFYKVGNLECNCGDHQYRCRQLGIRCKHQIALHNYLTSLGSQVNR